MKHSQTAVLLAGLIAAVLGIFYAEKAPYTYIAAAAVAVASIVGIAQYYHQARETEFAQQILSHLARSIPPSPWWKERIRELVSSSARSHGYILYKMLFTSSDPDDAGTDAVFLFHSTVPSENQASGLLVVKSDQYAELATLARNSLKSGVDELVYGNWGVDGSGSTASRLADSVVALYGLSHFREGFPVKLQTNAEESEIKVTAGSLELVVDELMLSRLCQEPAIVRDLMVARALEELDPPLGKYFV